MNEMLDYSERRIRTAISKAPDGEYYGEAHLDDDGINNLPVPIKVQLSIKGDTLNIDFEGTAEQVKSNMNSPFASSSLICDSLCKSVLTDPDIPFNEGAEGAINVKIPTDQF